jgi:hypothetical protein
VSDDKKTTSPSSGSGGTPANCTTVPCPKCCCCVTSVAIQNVRSIGPTATLFKYGTIDYYASNGHAFDFVMNFNFAAGTSGSSDCTFEWNEKVDLPAHATHPANTWTDMFTVGSPTSIIWIPWNNRVVPCPAGGSLSVNLTDPPSLGNAPGRTLTRTLEFRLVAKSGSGCSCGKTSATATAKQVLVMVNGTLDTSASSFTIGPSSTTP